jgi:uncharacterized protein (TIGR02145 family)
MKILFIAVLFILSNISYTQVSGQIKDTRDGNIYETIQIGNQIWLAQNLNTTKFRNGENIPQAKNREEWQKANMEHKPAWCYFNDREIQDDPINGENYGKLYNWYAVSDSRGLSPIGWHIPSDSEWTRLTNSLGGEKTAGIKMKSNSGWDDAGNGKVVKGFNGLPSGARYGSTFALNGIITYFWTSTDYDSNKAYTRSLGCCHDELKRLTEPMDNGFCVRCVKD